MLVLSRKIGEVIVMSELNVRITVVSTGRGRTRMAIEAPPSVRVLRAELCANSPDSVDMEEKIEYPAE